MKATVLYLNPSATVELKSLVEERLPAGWRLLVPGFDGPPTQLLPHADYIVVADYPVTATDLENAPRLRMIQHQGVGYEKIDTAACERRGVTVGLTPEGTTTGVAEHTLLLILAVYKQIVKASSGLTQGKWMQWELRNTSFELSGKRLGLIGFGRIGKQVARRTLAFEASISYFDPLIKDSEYEATRLASLEELLTVSDIVSLHVPATAQNRHLISAPELAMMRANAILINTARGSLVSEAALCEALLARRIAGAGLDVLEQEPPRPGNPLLAFDNVVITPHISAGTRDAFQTKMTAVFANLLRHSRGETPINLIPECQPQDKN